MSDLPAGWEQKKLGEIAFVTKLAGFEFTKYVKYSDASEIPVIRAQNVTKSGFQDGNFHYVSREILETLPRSRVRGGEILMVFVGSVGNVGLVPEGKDYFLGPNVAKIKIENERVFNKFILYFLMSDEGKASVNDFSKSTTQSSISMGSIREVLAPIPPLNEQKRIAEKLDSLLARVDSCQTHLERVPQILKRFRQSVLAAATSGRLTEDWREKQGKNVTPCLETIPEGGVPLPENYNRLGKIAFKLTTIEHSAKELPETWALLTTADLYDMKVLIDFADGNHGAMYPRKEDFGDKGALFLTASQIGENWEVDIHACPRLRSDKAEKLVKGWARKNDVLLTHNATVGRVALLEFGEEDVLLGTSVTFYRFNEKYVSPNYGRILFSSPFFQDQLKTEMSQTTRNQVPITKQVSLNFICPPIEEQAEIVRRVEKLFAYAERLEARYTSASEHVERLTPSLLAKAFRGELVGQEEPGNSHL